MGSVNRIQFQIQAKPTFPTIMEYEEEEETIDASKQKLKEKNRQIDQLKEAQQKREKNSGTSVAGC